MKRNLFTLTYNDKVLRLVKIDGKKISSVASADIGPGIVKGGKIERVKLFAELINELKAKAKPNKIVASEVIAAVPEEKIFLKTTTIPKMPVEKVDSAISYQLESIIPFKLAEVYYNWRIVKVTEDKLVVLIAVFLWLLNRRLWWRCV